MAKKKISEFNRLRAMKPQEPADWATSKPQEIGLFLGNLAGLIPPFVDIPADFRENRGKAREWIALQQQWFFGGLRGYQIEAKPGIDVRVAMHHLSCIMSSFEPKHEHKEAAVAWLMSLWLEKVEKAEEKA